MRVLGISLFVVIVDQISKLLVKGFQIPYLNYRHDGFTYGNSIPVFKDIFTLTFLENPGIAFGMSFGPMFKLIVPIVSILIAISIIYYIYYLGSEDRMKRTALALIFGGAIGNLIDRVFYGYFFDYAPLFHGKVVDFFSLNLNYISSNYVFNIADIAVFIGLVLFISTVTRKENIALEAVTSEIKD
ncbi:MAG: signal peptidase II [Syntrophothermus sp.]